MRVTFHCGYDGKPDESWYDDCVLDNRTQPILRCAGETFKSCYDIEWSCPKCHIEDPKRSLAGPVMELLGSPCEEGKWPTCDILGQLIQDIGLHKRHPTREDIIAFWTMFPVGVADCLANSYMDNPDYLDKFEDAIRVLNNPFFNKDRNAAERRIVEIAEDNGLRFALDCIAVIPTPDVLAREVALLNHGVCESSAIVEPVRMRLAASIADTMADWKLEPTILTREAYRLEKGNAE